MLGRSWVALGLGQEQGELDTTSFRPEIQPCAASWELGWPSRSGHGTANEPEGLWGHSPAWGTEGGTRAGGGSGT